MKCSRRVRITMQSLLYLAILLSLASQAAVACPGRCLCFRTTVRCMFLQLDNIPENIPTRTTILDLRFNRIKNIVPGVFKGLKNLNTLLLNNNHLESLPGQAFVGLSSLRYLYLYKNQIETIDRFAFQGLEKVEQVYIHFNRIEEIQPKTFANLPSIRRLFLHNNKLKRLPKGVFNHVPSLRRLRLDSNALICDCRMMWLAQMLQHDMRGMETAATCMEPRTMQGKSLTSVRMEEFHCKKPLLKREAKSRIDVSFGKTAYFKCQAEGDPDPEIIWFHNNITIPVEDLNEKYNVLDDGTLMIKNPEKADQGVYECVAKNDLGEAKSLGVELRYLGDDPAPRIPPAFTRAPTDAVVNEGGTVTLECYAQGAPRPTITWSKNRDTNLIRNPRFTVLPEGPLVISNIEFEDRGIYSCVARNELGLISASAGVLVQIPPRFVEVPQDIDVVEGQPASLRCRAHGYPPPNVQWIKDNIIQPTTSRQSLDALEGGSQLSFRYIRRIADRGQYDCVASSEAGTVVARAQLRVVARVPPTFTLRPRDSVAYALDEVRMPCQVQGEPQPNIRWFLGTTPLQDSDKYSFQGGALIIHNLTRRDEGRYECRASNGIDTIQSIAVLKVKDTNQEYIGDRFVNESVRAAIKEVNNAFDNTLAELYDKERTRSPSDLLTIFRLPTPSALAVTRAAEIFERTLENVLRAVAEGDKYNVTHSGAQLSYDEIISPTHLQIIANLSGCLNHRHVVECTDMCFQAQYRSHDGTCNNLQNPMWGASLTALQRMLKPRYDNGISTPAGWNKNKLHHGYKLPSARLISTQLIASNKVNEDATHTHMLMQWGQFLDHDITFTPMAVSNARFSDGRHCNETCENQSPCFPIDVPLGDPRIHRFKCLGFTRSSSMCGTGVTSGFLHRVAARQQLNQITSFIDASNVFGSSDEEANNLRDLTNERGFLKVGITPRNGRSFLPYNINAPVDCQIDPTRAHIPCFIAGDHRANEQLGLLSLHTIYMREHNRMAEVLLRYNPHWDGDHVYHETRKIIGATMQHITYSQWLPKVLGEPGMKMLGTYQGYNPSTDPSILNVFATAAFRFGHSLIQPIIYRLDEQFQQTEYGNLPLHKAFFAPYRLVEEGGVDPVLRGLFHIGMKKPEPDHLLNTELTERLFRLAHAVALDLAALNIQRGRDHGLPSYNSFRQYCNLTKAQSFTDFRREIKNVDILRKLKELYGHPDNVDLWVGGLVEEPIPGSRLGPTFMCIIVDQFKRLRDGDRFWYENPGVFSAAQLTQIKQSTLARVICDNNDGTLENIQNDVFLKVSYPHGYTGCVNVPKMDLKVWTDCCRDCSRNKDVSTLTNQLRQRRSTEFSYPQDRPQEHKAAPETVVDQPDTGRSHGSTKDTMGEMDAMDVRMEGVESEVERLNQFVGKLMRKVRRLEKQLGGEKSYCTDEQGLRRQHKEIWKEDECKTCKCKYSKVRCEEEQCPWVDCEIPRLIHGQCCPVC